MHDSPQPELYDCIGLKEAMRSMSENKCGLQNADLACVMLSSAVNPLARLNASSIRNLDRALCHSYWRESLAYVVPIKQVQVNVMHTSAGLRSCLMPCRGGRTFSGSQGAQGGAAAALPAAALAAAQI